MSSEFDFSFMMIALKAALKYINITIILAVVPFIIGIIVGTLIAIIRFFKIKILSSILKIYVVIIKGTPMVLLLLITYMAVIQCFDGLAIKFHWSIRTKNINTIYIAFVALSSFAIVNISETIRGALAALDKGQYESAYAVGLTTFQTLLRIILPQAVPIAIPMLCSNFIGLIKGSSLAFMISVTELLNASLITATSNYKYLEAYVAAALVYWPLCVIIEKMSYMLEKYFNINKINIAN